MTDERKRFILAVLTLVGTIIGVGLFGVPYALSRVGLVPAVGYFVVLTAVQLLQHLFYAEAAIACPDKLRLVGLVERYLGRRAKSLAAVSIIFGYWGGLLAYMIVGGTFLHVLLSPYLGGQEFAYQVAWAIFAATLVRFGLEVIAKISAVATVGLLVAMAVIFGLGLPHVRLDNLAVLWTGHDLFLPYGVILFSLSGLPAILEMEDILKGRHEKYRHAIILGTLAAAVLTAGFGFLVWGITGSATTSAAVDGLKLVLGGGIATVAAAFGFLAVATSFFATAINLQGTFQYDYKLPKTAAWLLTGGVPFAVFLLGAKDFVSIVGFTGAVFGGISAALVALLYVAVTEKRQVAKRPLGVPAWVAYVTIAFLSAGALIEAGATIRDILT